MKIKGKLIGRLPKESGTSQAGKEWSKQTVILETSGEYPKKIAIQNFNDNPSFNNLIKAAEYTISVNIDSREYNSKWYTNITAWKIEGETKQAEAPQQEQSNDSGDLPF